MARILIAACVLSLAAIAPAQDEIEIFDAHLHYNWEPQPFYSLEQVLTIFRRNKVTGILSTSRPNIGTHALVEAKPAGIWVVPFIRPHHTRADIGTWHNDPAIYELVENEYRRGYYRGVGEFHVYGQNAANEVAGKIVRFATERGLCLHAHCDDVALELLLLGSDTWINERWFGYDNIMREYRSWLAQLPRDQARRIASGNAERLFGPRKVD